MFNRKFSIGVVVIFITLFIYIGYIYNDYVASLSNIELRTAYINELEWTFIKSMIYEDYLAATNQAKIVADKLSTRLRDDYPDLNQLKRELSVPNKNKNTKYFYVMQSTIENVYLFNVNTDDNNNNVFICDKNGVLANTSRRARQNIQQFPLLWEEIYKEQTNLELTKNAVQCILQQKNNLIYWEFPNDDDIQVPKNIDIDALKQVYDTYGIIGFKNIQFLAPAYITTTGDIFGVDDVDIYGNKQENHKIIVVQTFNIYQQLMTRYSGDISKMNTFKDYIITSPTTKLKMHAFFIILIITMMIGLISFMLVQNQNKNKNSDNKSSNQ